MPPGLVVPGRMYLAEYNSPSNILPYGEQLREDYTLQGAAARALPEKEFQFETYLKRVAIVQDNTGKQPTGIRYVPGKSLEQQFTEERAREQKARRFAAQQRGPARAARTVALAAVLAALLGWYLYRRAPTLRRGR